MPLVAAAVCPHPPMLVPEVAAGAAAEFDELRSACLAAVRSLLHAGPRWLVVIGAGSSGAVRQPAVTASFAPFGVPLEFTLDRATAVAPDPLPVSLLVASWLLRESLPPASGLAGVLLCSVPDDLPAARCAAWRPGADEVERRPGTDEVERRPGTDAVAGPVTEGIGGVDGSAFDPAEPWALLVMGDGSACRTEKAPGYFDPRAEAFDESVAAALSAVDTDALLALDPVLAARLWCAGRAPWQVLAGLIAADDRPWTATVRYNDFPQGVTYLVAELTPGTTS